jgi:hypothetical protein
MADKSWPLHRKLMRAPGIGFNAEVYRWFKDVDDTNTTSASRKALRDSLLIGAKDSRTTAMFKITYFREQVQKVQYKPTIVGVTKDELDASISPKYKPHVILYFQQDLSAVAQGFTRLDARISFRLMDETNQLLTRAKLQTLATQIKTELATGNGWTFDKGKYITSYKDAEHGYNFQVYGINEAEGEKVVKKILSIRNHTFNDKLLSLSTPSRNSDNTPQSTTILGQTYKEPRWRPTSTVRFSYADVILHNLPEPICLVDKTGTKHNPIETAY